MSELSSKKMKKRVALLVFVGVFFGSYVSFLSAIDAVDTEKTERSISLETDSNASLLPLIKRIADKTEDRNFDPCELLWSNNGSMNEKEFLHLFPSIEDEICKICQQLSNADVTDDHILKNSDLLHSSLNALEGVLNQINRQDVYSEDSRLLYDSIDLFLFDLADKYYDLMPDGLKAVYEFGGHGLPGRIDRVGCALDRHHITVESKLDYITSQLDFITTDELIELVGTIDAKLDTINATLDEILIDVTILVSKIEVAEEGIFTILSTLDQIDVLEKIETVDSKVDLILDEAVSIESKLDNWIGPNTNTILDNQTDTIIPRLVDIDGDLEDTVIPKLETIDSKLDLIDFETVSIESKLDNWIGPNTEDILTEVNIINVAVTEIDTVVKDNNALLLKIDPLLTDTLIPEVMRIESKIGEPDQFMPWDPAPPMPPLDPTATVALNPINIAAFDCGIHEAEYSVIEWLKLLYRNIGLMHNELINIYVATPGVAPITIPILGPIDPALCP